MLWSLEFYLPDYAPERPVSLVGRQIIVAKGVLAQKIGTVVRSVDGIITFMDQDSAALVGSQFTRIGYT